MSNNMDFCISHGSLEKESQYTYMKRFITGIGLYHYGGRDMPQPAVCQLETQESWWCNLAWVQRPGTQGNWWCEAKGLTKTCSFRKWAEISFLIMFVYWSDVGWPSKMPWNNSDFFSLKCIFHPFEGSLPWKKHQMRNQKTWIVIRVVLLAMWHWIILIL